MSNEVKKNYTDAELDKMNNAELAALGTELDDVTVAFRKERYPVEGDPRENSAARGIATWLTVSVISGIAFLGVYLFWPWEPRFHGDEGLAVYNLYTPLLGLTAMLGLGSLGIATVQYVKKFIPEEISVQRRHDGRSSELDRRTTTALLNDAWQTSTLGRRTALKGLLGTSAILSGLMIAAPLGGLIKDPWRPRHELGYAGDGTLWTHGWTLAEQGQKIYLGRDTGAIAELHEGTGGSHYTTAGVSRLVRMRPEDLAAASMETVFRSTRTMSTTARTTTRNATCTKTTCTPSTARATP